MAKHLALLRGINVGGKNKLPMAKLIALFEELGCEDVQTYIQSGNVVFEASAALANGLATKVASRIKKDFGLTVPVQLRSKSEVTRALRTHPLARGVDESDRKAALRRGRRRQKE